MFKKEVEKPSASSLFMKNEAAKLGMFPKLDTSLNFKQNYSINGASITPGEVPSTGGALKASKMSGTSADAISTIASAAIDLTNPIIQSLGGRRADVSGGYEAYADAVDKIGLNPQLLAATGGLSALPSVFNKVNEFAGKTTDKQGTIGQDTGGYSFAIASGQDKKKL